MHIFSNFGTVHQRNMERNGNLKSMSSAFQGRLKAIYSTRSAVQNDTNFVGIFLVVPFLFVGQTCKCEDNENQSVFALAF